MVLGKCAHVSGQDPDKVVENRPGVGVREEFEQDEVDFTRSSRSRGQDRDIDEGAEEEGDESDDGESDEVVRKTTGGLRRRRRSHSKA